MGVATRLAATAGAIGALWLGAYGPPLMWAPPAIVAAGCLLMEAGSSGRKLSRFPGGRLRKVVEGVTENHGRAEWMGMKEAVQHFPGPAPYGGVVLGEACRVDQTARGPFEPADRRTWGKGGRARLLTDPCTSGPTHSLVFAGSGGFKTVSAVSTILTWTGSSVVLDPSCEVGPMVREALEAQGKRVHFIDPQRPAGAQRWGFNALDWIDPKDPLAEMHVHTVVGWIFGESPARQTEEDQFFRKWGRDMVAALLAHLVWDDSGRVPKSLATLRAGVATPEKAMRRVLRDIHEHSNSRMARHLAGSLMDIVDETFSGIYANANQGTGWLSVPAFADLVSGDAFHSRELADGDTTIFVQIPLPAMMHTPGVARVIIGAMLNAVYRADGQVNGRVLFLLDEAARLGKMKVIETARDVGRKYGITLQLLYQSVGQLEEQWGRDGKRAWYDGVSWRAYAAVQDMDTARELSAACGERGVMAYSEGENQGSSHPQSLTGGSRSKGRNLNVHEIKRPLIKPDELMQDARGDEVFIIARGCKPIRCSRAIFFRRPEMVAQVNTSRFHNAA